MKEVSSVIYFTQPLIDAMGEKSMTESDELVNFFKKNGIVIYKVTYNPVNSYALITICQTNKKKLDSFLFLVDTKDQTSSDSIF